jgi:3-hydroxyisobutyrate dehydrogenase
LASGTDLRVGYIGLGNMGGPMATNIAKAGFDLLVYDLRDEALTLLESFGARRAESIAEVAASVDILCTCVLYDHQVRDIFLGDDGILANSGPGLIATVHSTVPPQVVIDLAAAAADNGVQLLDAPVTGASAESAAGTLNLILGGDQSAIDRAAPVFEVVSSRMSRVGDPGMGQVVKLGNNIMSITNSLVVMEAVRFVETFGVDKSALFEVAQAGSGASYAVGNYPNMDRFGAEHTLAGSPELPFKLAKDLRYALEVAQERWTYLPIVGLASQLLPGMFTERWKNPPEDSSGSM